MSVIEVHDLEKSYRNGWFGKQVHALKGVSLQVNQGEIFGLLGPNGAGKTTLIKILLGIVRKTGGQATVLGSPAGSRKSRIKVGYLPENHRIPRHLTGNTALEFYGALSGMSLGDIRAKRPALLELVGLAERGTDSVSTYSKGMLQRLGLAQAMLHDPDLIILDEPTDGVDPVGRSDIRAVLRQIKSEGRTIFLNSHLLQEVEQVSDRVAILDRGQVMRIGGVDELTLASTAYDFVVVGTPEAITQSLTGYEVSQAQPSADNTVRCTISLPAADQVDRVIDKLRQAGIGIRGIARCKSSLEDVFIRIVQSADQQSPPKPKGKRK